VSGTIHPRDALFEPEERAPPLPVCDHYSGVEARMRKSLELQRELGPVFDVTLDGEDGAPVGGEIEHAALIAELVNCDGNRYDRVGARLLPVDHPRFEAMAELLVGRAGARLAYLMCPKPRGLADVERAAACIDESSRRAGLTRPIPLHALIETHGALRDVQALAFGLMDFVSAHRGAIPASAMGVDGQFEHPLVLRAKLEIAAACHAAARVPSHSVVTEIRDHEAISRAARMASRRLGYTRMWSIHPAQIRPIVEAFAPDTDEVEQAGEILVAAQDAQWAPIRHRGRLHDRASYRYWWQVLERAERTALGGTSPIAAPVHQRFFAAG
jgi:citrate lyase subunit beta / citryl-CoA lyase